MNYGLGENLTLNILGPLAVSAIYSGWGEPWKVWCKIWCKYLPRLSIINKAYRVYNKNSQIIQESSNMVINDTGYDHNIFDNQILTQKSIGDNPKDS